MHNGGYRKGLQQFWNYAFGHDPFHLEWHAGHGNKNLSLPACRVFFLKPHPRGGTNWIGYFRTTNGQRCLLAVYFREFASATYKEFPQFGGRFFMDLEFTIKIAGEARFGSIVASGSQASRDENN